MSVEISAERQQVIAKVVDSWRGLGWQLLREEPLAPALNVALDEVLTRRVGAGERPPTVRFWSWAAQAVIIGRFQSVRNEVREEEALARDVAIVRRITGGGAMFVQPDATITYSIYLPERYVEGLSFAESYAALDSWVVATLRDLGVDAWYAPLNDITSAEGKIGGAAQARRAKAVLHHTTIAYQMDTEEMAKILRIGQEKLSDKGIASAAKRVSPLRRQTDLPRAAIVERLTDGFRERFGLVAGELSAEECAAAAALVAEQYGTDGWTHDLP
ncbi:MAG TPA: biotin/lipoate A/B protein ligase family protein [Thermomicrobiales bacterium]|jgi:lipoate-protein ligase A